MDEQLKTKTARGLAWSAVEKIGVHGIGFAIGVLVARTLAPRDYGLMGMILVFIALSEMLVNSGLSQALVQKQDRDQTDFSSTFWLNLAIAVGLYGVLVAAAPAIAAFYRAPALVDLTRVAALVLPLNALTVVHRAKLNIAMNFKVTAVASLAAVIVSGLVAFALALRGLGTWALVAQLLVRDGLTLLILWLHDRWLPDLAFCREAAARLFRYGRNLMLAGLIGVLHYHVYALLIGRAFSKDALGYYTRGRSFAELPTSLVAGVLQSVAFPLYAQLQSDPAKVAEVHGKLIRATALLVLPLMTILAVVAEPFLRVFLTEKWVPAAVLMQWLCLARVFVPFSGLNINVLNAIGRSDLFLRIDLIKVPIIIGALVVTLPFGVRAVVAGQALIAVVAFLINAYYPGKLLGYGAMRQLRAVLPVLGCTAVMAATMVAFDRLVASDALKLAAGIPLGGLVFLASAWLLRVEELGWVWGLLRRLGGRRGAA